MGDWTDVVRIFEYCDTNDMSVAFCRVIEQEFGPDPFRPARVAFYKRVPVTWMTVRTDCHEVTLAVRGTVGVRGMKGFFEVGGEHGEPILSARVLKRDQPKVEELFARVQDHLKTDSIYKGKATTFNREFLNLSKLDFSKLVYNEKVMRDLSAHVWTLFERPKECRDADVPSQRKVLFAGPFGGGKTMAILLTARKATEHGWTVIYLEPTIAQASGAVPVLMEFARKYQPALVIIDDVDREQRETDPYALGRILTAVDGTLSKSGQVVVLMTTNFPDKIAGGMQRPGRIDRIINFGNFTGADGVRLLKTIIPAWMLAPDINWTPVEGACRDYMPAFVNEVGTSAKLLAINDAKSGDAQPVVTEALLLEAAEDLRAQHKASSQDAMGFKGTRQ